MDQPEATPTTDAQADLRTWVTPTFEQTALKDALAGTPNIYAFDGGFYYS